MEELLKPWSLDGLSLRNRLLMAPVDSVLLAAGLRPRPLPEEFKTIVPEIHVIGDASKPRDIGAATRAGYEAGIRI